MSAEWKWLDSTRTLQRDAFGFDWDGIHAEGNYPSELAKSVQANVTSLTAEIGEFLQEVPWKPWTNPLPKLAPEARARAVGELIDVGHFLANLLVALGVTDDEWETRYQAKQGVNRQRQVDGYDGVSTKCPRCKRDFSDVPPIIEHDVHKRVADETGSVCLSAADELVKCCGACSLLLAAGPDVLSMRSARWWCETEFCYVDDKHVIYRESQTVALCFKCNGVLARVV